MKNIKPLYNCRLFISLAIILLVSNAVLAQTIKQEKMQQLSFMVGEWIGVSTTYKNDTIATQIPAFQKISYLLDKNIITIDLHSESLQLHTVIYYDEKEEKYFYNSYYKNGAGRYPAEFKDGKFVVQANDKKRFIFNINAEGNFQEYGEKLEEGKWVKYFEDNFKGVP